MSNVFTRQLSSVSTNTSSIARNDWTKAEIQAIYDMPLMDLVYKAAETHRKFFNAREVQQCTLLSIKTGGCVEDCKYCSQSSKAKTHVKATPTMKTFDVIAAAQRAKEAGSTRFCMGAAWRNASSETDGTQDRKAFERVLGMVREVRGMGMEVCCTLGMLTGEQAVKLKEAGLTAYNHNLDTSREYYPEVISTRSYDDRLETISNVRKAGISVCSGGILGMGEQPSDRVGLLHTLATMEEHPESVPINSLVPVEGTPLKDSGIAKPPTAIEMTRMIATARCVLPGSMVRLSAGRMSFTEAEQALMFLAGANSIFYGDQLLTTSNPETEKDKAMFKSLGLVGKPPHSAPLIPSAEENVFVISSSNDDGGVRVDKVVQRC
jgi:biotin synthase